jgi:hypothetical protein
MFAHEGLHEAWLGHCTDYVRHLYGASLRGRVVVDYAFGRGNFTLAFVRAGAERVIAVEASRSAVDRLTDIVRWAGIGNVDVLLGNVDEGALPIEADLVWIYGIYQNMQRPRGLLQAARTWLRGESGELAIYAYNESCLRQVVVEACRAVLTDRTPEAFLRMQQFMPPKARRRARDDITSPVVRFMSPEELSQDAAHVGLDVVEQVPDFADFAGQAPKPEFEPYVLKLCPEGRRARVEIVPQRSPHPDDVRAIGELAHHLLAKVPAGAAERVAIGLFSTHFAAGVSPALYSEALLQDWLFLVFQLVSAEVPTAGLGASTVALIERTVQASRGRTTPVDNPGSFLQQNLYPGRVRL